MPDYSWIKKDVFARLKKTVGKGTDIHEAGRVVLISEVSGNRVRVSWGTADAWVSRDDITRV